MLRKEAAMQPHTLPQIVGASRVPAGPTPKKSRLRTYEKAEGL